ncbi:unnamed protein product [Amoebophrya sp. A25]|nr:unnamed protein product [Amoebophrya sp. A25]|eukprot:GSA25T00012779001.1
MTMFPPPRKVHQVLLATTAILSILPEGILADDGPPSPEWRKAYTMPVDHFDDRVGRKTFEMQVLGYGKHSKPDGPIFFYAGNEGPIDGFWDNTGLPFAWAPDFNADIVFAEHRYYGKSLPFGEDSFSSPDKMRFLRVEQALADYAAFMMKYNTGCQEQGFPSVEGKTMKLKSSSGRFNLPPCRQVVVFGGSYGGILASLLRQKYPTLFHAAIAASAPIPQAFYMTSPTSEKWSTSEVGFSSSSFYESITHSAKMASETCPVKVRDAFQKLEDTFGRGHEHELENVRKTFNLCQKELKSSEWSHFMQYARNAWTMAAMCDYPYPTSFLAPLPANPIKTICGMVDSAKTTIEGLAAAVSLVYGGSSARNKTSSTKFFGTKHQGAATCLDMYSLFVECADQTGCGTDNDAKSWDYQMCADMTIIVASNGKSDMFAPREWGFKNLTDYCLSKYGVQPRPTEMAGRLGAWQFEAFPESTSNIVFSNGLLDPWHPGGYLKNLTDSVVALQIPSGAHHLDLRLPNKDDPTDVLAIRETEKTLVKQWLGVGNAAVPEQMDNTRASDTVVEQWL